MASCASPSAAIGAAMSSLSPLSTSTGARSAVRSRRRSSPSRTAPASSRAPCRCRTSSSRRGRSSTASPPHMADYPDDAAFRPADLEPTDIAAALRASGAEVLLCYLPVGSEQAVKHYAQACLDAGVAMINCVPVFLASDPGLGAEVSRRGHSHHRRRHQKPGRCDDRPSGAGAAVRRPRGQRSIAPINSTPRATPIFSICSNGSACKSKKISKTESVQSQLDERLDAADIHIGPSDYVPWQKRQQGLLHPHGGARLRRCAAGDRIADCRWRIRSNSAGVVIDAIRCAKLGLDRGVAGPLEAPSAYYMKNPAAPVPRQRRARGVQRVHRGRSFRPSRERRRKQRNVRRTRRS